MAAAKALAVSANKEAELVSLERLIGFFKHQYYDQRLGLPSPNDFSDFSLYYLKVAVLQAISSVKDKEGYTPPELLDFLLDLLKNNENSQNPVCFPFYSSLLSSFTPLLSPTFLFSLSSLLSSFRPFLPLFLDPPSSSFYPSSLLPNLSAFLDRKSTRLNS